MDYFKLAAALTRAEAAPTLVRVAIKYRAIQMIAAHAEDDATDDDDECICGHCCGSGEGMHDGAICGYCGGSGVASSMTAEDIEDAKADAYNDEQYWRETE